MWMLVPIICLAAVAVLEMKRAERWKDLAMQSFDAYNELAEAHRKLKNDKTQEKEL